jgi:S-adenosylmethionine:tRNA ribosyltransferase-isomerase
MRTLESLYWFGVKLSEDENSSFNIHQNEPYNKNTALTKHDAFKYVLRYMERYKTDVLIGETSIFIKPGYTFRVCNALITNFHQPGSTLILLVAAFIGHDWKRVYESALQNDYRFLSYGDSSLLIP